MFNVVDGGIKTVRRLATELRPSLLDDLGLIAAVEWQVKQFQERSGLDCSLTLPEHEPTVDQDQSIALFRILQEALTNIARHALATRMDICLKESDSHIILEVQDNGVGITPRQATGARSFGLLGIRERATVLGGQVEVAGEEGRGTSLIVRIPLEYQATAECQNQGSSPTAMQDR